MKKARGAIMCVAVWLIIAGGFIVNSFLVVRKYKAKSEIVEVSNAVPEIKLTLNNITLDEINDGPKRVEYIGNKMVAVINNNEYSFDNVGIRGRGNASWLMPKKSYRIKLGQKVDIFGLGKIKKWAMIANYTDFSLMRNDLGNYIAGLLFDNYPIRGKFTKFIVDDRNLGLYYMSKLVTIDKNSVDLRSPLGIIAEMDNVYCESEEKYRMSIFGNCISVDDVVEDDKADEALEMFMRDYKKFERAIEVGDYEIATEVMDMDSLARYFLLSELSSNPDAYVTSWYLYKDGEDDKIHSSIGWDFDGAFGNENWWWRDDELYSPTELMARMKVTVKGWDDYDNTKRCKLLNGTIVSPVMCYALNMPEFRYTVEKVYQEKLLQQRDEILSYVSDVANYIREDAIANNKIWGEGDFDKDVEYLIWWTNERFDYLDGLFGGGWQLEPRYL